MRGCLVLFLCGCGALSSGAGAPTNPPSSGLGTIVPLEDGAGLDWTPPYLLSDAAIDLRHPSALVLGDAIDLWVEARKGTEVYIAHSHVPSFEQGSTGLADELRAFLPWQAGGIGSPSVLPASDGGVLLFYVAAGQLGLVRYAEDGTRVDRPTPLYTPPSGAIRSMAAGLADDQIHIVLLVEDAGGRRLDEVVVARAALERGDAALVAHPTGLPTPPWATELLDVGQRISRTAVGRLRQDLFLGATLPSAADLGAGRTPSAIGAAARYLGDEAAPFELVAAPILSGSPPPSSATVVGYRGGVLVLYAAPDGPRTGIGVGLHP